MNFLIIRLQYQYAQEKKHWLMLSFPYYECLNLLRFVPYLAIISQYMYVLCKLLDLRQYVPKKQSLTKKKNDFNSSFWVTWRKKHFLLFLTLTFLWIFSPNFCDTVGDKTRQNPGLSFILVFFSDLEVELLTLKIFIFDFFWILFLEPYKEVWNGCFDMCRSKIGQNLDPVHWIEKKLFSKKTFFLIKIFFPKKTKKSGENAFFRRKNFFDSMHWVQILSNFTLTHIKTSALNFFLRFQKQNSKKIKNKIFKVKSSTSKSLKNTKMGLNPGFWRVLSPIEGNIFFVKFLPQRTNVRVWEFCSKRLSVGEGGLCRTQFVVKQSMI